MQFWLEFHYVVQYAVAMHIRLAPKHKKLSWCWQTRATRLEVSQGQQTWYSLICMYSFLLVFYSNFVPLKYSTCTCKYTVTFTPGLGVTQVHRNRHVSIRHYWQSDTTQRLFCLRWAGSEFQFTWKLRHYAGVVFFLHSVNNSETINSLTKERNVIVIIGIFYMTQNRGF